jgi:hypothetical protein
VWNEWLAAECCNGARCYRRYVEALAEEARAAADLERIVTAARPQKREAHVECRSAKAA